MRQSSTKTAEQHHSASSIECIAGPIQNDPPWSISTESDHTVRGWPGKKRDEEFFHTERVWKQIDFPQLRRRDPHPVVTLRSFPACLH